MKYLIGIILVAIVAIAGCTAQQQTTTAPAVEEAQQQVQQPQQLPEPPQEVEQQQAEEPQQEQQPEVKTFDITAKQWQFVPDTITVNKGDRVVLSIRSVDVTHGISIPDFGVNERLEPGKVTEVEFVADKTGTFSFVCSVFCGAGHSNMRGTLIVE
jgi:cytochrome c oxidase subunit 2